MLQQYNNNNKDIATAIKKVAYNCAFTRRGGHLPQGTSEAESECGNKIWGANFCTVFDSN